MLLTHPRITYVQTQQQVQGLRAAYEDVTIRLPAAGPPASIFARAESFVQLEAVLPSGPEAVGNAVWPLVESWQLEELSYRVVSTLRCVCVCVCLLPATLR